MGCGPLAAPGMGRPARPPSGGTAAPKSGWTKSQKLVRPMEEVVMDPEGSATAS